MEQQYVLVSKELFEKLVAERAENEQRTIKIVWGTPMPSRELDALEGLVYEATVEAVYPDEPEEGSPG